MMSARMRSLLLVTVLVVATVAGPVPGPSLAVQVPAAETGQLTETNRAVSGVDGSTAQSAQSASDAATDESRAADSGATLSGAVRHQLTRADPGERVPVVVVFDTQPDEAFDLGSLGEDAARAKMQDLARREQQRARSYLERQRQRGRAADIRSFWSRNAMAVEATPATVRELATLPNVERIVYDQRVTPLDNSTPESFEEIVAILSQYGNLTEPTGFETSSTGERAWGVEYVGADDVQEHGVTGAGVNVSVVDTGIDESHPALEGQVTRWKDFTGDNFTEPRDPFGHGTHVAGTIAGKPNASYAVGVAPGADLFGAKVFSENEPTRLSDLMAAFDWSAENGADVISASVGVPPIVDSYSDERSTGDDGNASLEVPIYTSANGTTSESTDEAYEPAYVMVVVEPEAINGTALGSENQSRVMNNSTVTLADPGGSTPLTRVEADWAYLDGEVPSTLGFYKFKPGGDWHINSTGNWSLTISYKNAGNVTYDVVAAPVYPTNGTDELAASIDTVAESHGVVPVVAAGNYGYVLGNRTVASPGAAEHAITVGASGYKVSDVAAFSSRGPVGYDAAVRPGIDVVAPGTAVLSAYPTELTPDGYDPYTTMSGTSMATPHVSGTVALMLDADPSLSRSQVESILEGSAQAIPGGESAVGGGMLDAWAAVNATNASALSANASTEAGIHELHAGVGDTASEWVLVRREPALDPEGDAGSGPDLRAASQHPLGSLSFATVGDGPRNATVRVYLDADRTDSTGDPDQSGAEYQLVLERTFDGAAYALSVTTLAYNASTDSYEPTTDLDAWAGDVDGELIQVTGVDVDPDLDRVPDWHATVAARGGSVTDRLPDSGQVRTASASLEAVAVAWNASAGAPDDETSVTFGLYDRETGTLVGNRTVATAHDGTATTTFSVAARHADLSLEITDPYGNRIAQRYVVGDACIVGCYTSTADSGGLAYEVAEREYLTRSNETVTLDVPIYNGTDMSPYTGQASVRLTGTSGETVTYDNLSVSDGVLTLTVDLGASTLDDSDGVIDVDIALTENFSNASATADAGSIEVRSDAVTRVAPTSTVAEPGGSVTMSFQHSRFDGTPLNETAEYVALWVTDRMVQAFYRDLPRDTRQRLERRLKAVKGNGSARDLTAGDREEIREAVRNVSTQGTNYDISWGTAEPDARGVGTFQVSPPADARYGFVFASARNVSGTYGFGLLLVDDRIRPYADNQTEPGESGRYDLDVHVGWDDWGQHREGDYLVPNDTYTVHVSLYDREHETYVDDAKVTLYAIGGETVTVKTSGEGPVSVDLSAPDVDWQNASWHLRYQEVLGVAHGYHDADGSSVSETEVFYGDVDRVAGMESVVNPLPSLAYDNGTVEVTIDYENETWDDVEGEKTLVILRSARAWKATRDLHVGYVDPGNNSTTTLDVTDSQPPADDEERTYAVDTQSASMDDDRRWRVTTSVEGASVAVDLPSQLTDERTANVTLVVRNRNGSAVEGAVVVWSYVLYAGDGARSGQASLPLKIDGDTFVGTTGPNGTVTFAVAPDIPENTTGLLGWQASFATENVSRTEVRSGTLEVVQNRTATVTGTFAEPDGSAAADDTVAVLPTDGGEGGLTQTNATGGFSQLVHADHGYDVQYYQRGSDGGWAPRDGTVDVFAAERVTVSNDTDIGTHTLPTGYVVNVTVVNESGAPVSNATVEVVHEASDGATAGLRTLTPADGMLYANDSVPGVELAGNVTVRVSPPENGLYVQNTTVRNLTVSSSRNLTVQVNETGNVTLSGTIREADGDPATTDWVEVANATGPFSAAPETDGDGTFTAIVEPNATYTLGYHQDYPRAGADGSPDLYVLPNVTVGSSGADLGTVHLPDAHRLNLTVVNQIGFPVDGATVTVAHVANNTSVATGWLTTDSAGHVYHLGTRGVELNGTARVVVRSPDGGNRTVRTVDLTADEHLTVQVNTSEGTKPVANVTANATRVNVSEAVGLDASGSLDDDGIVAYDWAFGDGESATGQTTTHRFTDLGTYTVEVTVADADGNTDTATVRVEVVDEVDPRITNTSVNTTEATRGGDPVAFSVSASDNHRVASYAWDFDGDGTVDEVTSAPTTEHVYNDTGSFTPTVTVFDESDNARTAQFSQVNVSEPSGSGGSGGGGGGGGGGGSEESVKFQVIDLAQGAGVKVRDAKIGAEFTADTAGMVADGVVSVRKVDFEMRFADSRFNVRILGPRESPPDGVPDLRGGTAIRYLEFNRIGLDSADFDQARIHFTVDFSALPEGASAGDVALFRYHDGKWRKLNTRSLGNGRYVATSPGFSAFAVGVVSADIRVTDVGVPSRTVTAGESATVKVTLKNAGGKRGSKTVRVSLDDTVVAEKSVTVKPGTSKTVTVSFEPDAAGTYTLTVAGTDAGELTVEPGADATATGTDGDGSTASPATTRETSPGFGRLVAVLALLGAVALRYRRVG